MITALDCLVSAVESNDHCKVISGFPGIGKSFFTKNAKGNVSDSDSSMFSWSSPGVRNPEFPENYMDHLTEQRKVCDYVLVSSHKDVRAGMLKRGFRFFLVYPRPECKDEYIQRYIDRGSPESFVEMMKKNFDMFVEQCRDERDPKITHIFLPRGMFLGSPEVMSMIDK